MKDRDWDQLLLMLERQSCILLLGSEWLTPTHPQSPALLAAHLATEIGVPELAQRGLTHVAERFESVEGLGRPDLEYEIGRFFMQEASVPPELVSLAALPFHLVLSTSHDNLMYKAFEATGKTPVAEAYHYRGRSPDLVRMGTASAPLIYRLYGSPREPGSLVVTESDLLDFLVNVLTGNPGLPYNIRSELQRNVSFLFVGFGIHHWYLRLLLHVLEFSRRKKAFALEPLRLPNTTEEGSIFFYAGYSIEVISRPLEAFVTDLLARYEERQPPHRAADDIAALASVGALAPKVFISYAREDRADADTIYDALAQANVDVWMDRQLTAGDDWNRLIEARLNDADYCVVVHSHRLATKAFSYVNKEINLALDRQRFARTGVRFLIPVLVDESPLMEDLRSFQAVPLSALSGSGGLIAMIRRDFQRRNRA